MKRVAGVEPLLRTSLPGAPPAHDIQGGGSGPDAGRRIQGSNPPASRPPESPSIPLRNKGGVITAYAKVDADVLDEVQVFRWYQGNHGYAMRFSGRESVLLHRYLAGAQPGEVVDHINRDPLDNRRSNLRITDRAGNYHNSTKVRAGSGYRNVYPWGKRWIVRFQRGDESIKVGVFDTPEEANEAAGEYRRLNLPTSPEATTHWPLLTAAEVWGTHFLRCFFCVIGDRYTADRFCETGRELIVAMLDELHDREMA